jgi:lysyl-tRNA synthetase class 2
MLPKATDGGLTDQEIRYRKRHLDLIMHNDVRNIFITRSKVVNYVRKYLDSMGFMEVSCYIPAR